MQLKQIKNQMNAQQEEEFVHREVVIERHLIAARQCTLPLVRARIVSEINMAISLQQELCRQAKVAYSAPSIPGPKRPEIKMCFPSVVLRQGDKNMLTNIVSKVQMTPWQHVIFCFFSGVRFTRSLNVAAALLETEWSRIEETTMTFSNLVNLATLQQVPEYEEIFRQLEPLKNLENLDSLTCLETLFPGWGDGQTFAIASNSQLTVLLWPCKDEHLLIHTHAGNVVSVISNTNLSETLAFMQYCVSEKFTGFLVKKRKSEKGK